MSATAIMIFLLVSVMFAFLIKRWMTRRATIDVIGRFCKLGALNWQDAKTQEELGLNPPSFVQRITRPRDYKPYVVKELKRLEVIRTTRDGKMYMVQGRLHPDYRCGKEDQHSREFKKSVL